MRDHRLRWLIVAVLAVAFAIVVSAPYYVLGHRYFPKLRHCEYYHDFVSFRDWEAWSSYLVAPIAAVLLAILGTRAAGRLPWFPVLVLMLVPAGLIVFTIAYADQCPD